MGRLVRERVQAKRRGISGDALDLAPYRIEWRANLVTHWLLMETAETHDEVLKRLGELAKEHNGQVRAVAQHVIEAKGLGA